MKADWNSAHNATFWPTLRLPLFCVWRLFIFLSGWIQKSSPFWLMFLKLFGSCALAPEPLTCIMLMQIFCFDALGSKKYWIFVIFTCQRLGETFKSGARPKLYFFFPPSAISWLIVFYRATTNIRRNKSFPYYPYIVFMPNRFQLILPAIYEEKVKEKSEFILNISYSNSFFLFRLVKP